MGRNERVDAQKFARHGKNFFATLQRRLREAAIRTMPDGMDATDAAENENRGRSVTHLRKWRE